MERLAPMCISMKTEDYLQLPERMDIVRNFNLSKKTADLYAKMERDLFLEVDENEIDVVNAAALNNKLLQISSGAVYDDQHEVAYLHDEKLEALDQLIEEAQGENVFLFYSFIHEKERIKRRYPEAVDIKDPGAIQRWKDGNIKILLAHPASAGHGLNLQSGGSISIWFSLPTSLELYQQSIKRLHRQGQTKVVKNFILLAKDTYDEDVYYRILQSKEKVQSALLEAIKARINSTRR